MSSNFRPDTSGQIKVSDDTKKPPETFVTTKVPLRHPNGYIVFRVAPN